MTDEAVVELTSAVTSAIDRGVLTPEEAREAVENGISESSAAPPPASPYRPGKPKR